MERWKAQAGQLLKAAPGHVRHIRRGPQEAGQMAIYLSWVGSIGG